MFEKYKYQKPLFHNSVFWTLFLFSFASICYFCVTLFNGVFGLLMIFLLTSTITPFFFNFFIKFFYLKKYHIKGVVDFTIYERADFFYYFFFW